ncbi:HlyD family secretion protein [gamma proteobacterium HdN1]|nr:HlyD family secretion protein [gamma proteobacterium HdN1]
MGCQQFRQQSSLFMAPLLFVVLALLFVVLALGGCGAGEAKSSSPSPSAKQPPAVETTLLKTQPLELTERLPARIVASRIAEIRPQVSGLILHRYFEEGAKVREGDKLYQIDSALYEAALASAQAQQSVAEANADIARLKVKRYRKIVGSQAVSEQDLDDAEAQARQADAQVRMAKAAVMAAQVNLNYTLIRAPISGVIDRSVLTEGALVTAQQAVALTTIRQLEPIYVDIQRPVISSETNVPHSLDVTLELVGGRIYHETGKQSFTSASVDPGTGSVVVRARFANLDGVLLPGMFVQAQISGRHLDHALLIPEVAVVRQPNGVTTTFVVTDQDKVERRVIKISQAVGNQWLVLDGLKEGERVVTSGIQKISNGDTVIPVDAASENQAGQIALPTQTLSTQTLPTQTLSTQN